MPWCDDCARWHSPNALTPEGRCPACGRPVATSDGSDEEVPTPERPPWHFWLLLVAVALYLAWRLVQGVAWMIEKV